MRKYTPRRAGARWREGAPDYVLDVFDHPDFHDRYSVLLTGDTLVSDGTFSGTYIQGIGLSESGASNWFDVRAYEAAAYRYSNHHRRIRWLDLPECVRAAVVARVTEE